MKHCLLHSKKVRRPLYQRRDRFTAEPQDLTMYTALNCYNGEVYFCESLDHACAIAFGKNKREHSRHWSACIRTSEGFVML